MISIRVLAPGFQTTVQDLGRFGYAHLGISASGAADSLAFRIANLLVGNDENSVALEMTLTGSTLYFEGMPGGKPLTVALAGSDFMPQLDGARVPLWQSFEVMPGQTLRMGGTTSGARCYLAVAGGLQVHKALGSASTHLLSRFGGYQGRALKRGDILELAAPETFSNSLKKLDADFAEEISRRRQPRIIPGAQQDWFVQTEGHDSFSIKCFSQLHGAAYMVSETSNRTGLRLTGTPITTMQHKQLFTEGVPLGALQVTPDGQPIIVFVEQQTTGGYPKIANVIAADLHRLGQLRPRDQFTFEVCSPDLSLSLLRQQEEALKQAVGNL